MSSAETVRSPETGSSADPLSESLAGELPLSKPLIVGFGITGRAIAKSLVERDITPTVIDDRSDDDLSVQAAALGVRIVLAPQVDDISSLVEAASALLPSPGVPDHHPAFAAAQATNTPILSEFDLAGAWDNRPIVAITGTNGKTSVTMLVTEALNRSGLKAEAVGNTDIPFVAALGDEETDVFVVEASSFRLAHSRRFAPNVAGWLNFAPDHLDAHAGLDAYKEAKASIWSHLSESATAVANADDPVVMDFTDRVISSGASLTAFSIGSTESSPSAPWRVDGVGADSRLVGPAGFELAVSRLQRSQPHDLANGLAVAALSIAAGAKADSVIDTLVDFGGMAHRVELVGERDGVRWFNDSKATVPHATLAAVGGFGSVVLIAGGRNKGLDLGALRQTVPPVKAVVATGNAGPEIEAIFDGVVPVLPATSMETAVEAAQSLAEPGDVVLLSPSCTSFDWYPNYAARGVDFRRIVEEEVLAL